MPPHCDAMDGPVVKAALAALAASDVRVVLPFVDEAGEAEVRALFDEVSAVRPQGGIAGEIAERLFLETVVRLHRATEGAPFTGLKPAGLDHGPVIPVAERAIATGSPEELVHELSRRLEDEVKARLDNVMALKARSDEGLREARRYASAMLELQVWSNQVYRSLQADTYHGHLGGEPHERPGPAQGPSTEGADDPISHEGWVRTSRENPQGGGRR